MICYVLAIGKQHLGPRVVLGPYGIKSFGHAFSLRHQITWFVLSFGCLLYVQVHCMKDKVHTYTLFQP